MLSVGLRVCQSNPDFTGCYSVHSVVGIKFLLVLLKESNYDQW